MLWFLTIFLYKSIHVGLVNDLQAFDDNICHRILWTKTINFVSYFPFKNDTFMSVTLLSKILLYKNYHEKIVILEYLEIGLPLSMTSINLHEQNHRVTDIATLPL